MNEPTLTREIVNDPRKLSAAIAFMKEQLRAVELELPSSDDGAKHPDPELMVTQLGHTIEELEVAEEELRERNARLEAVASTLDRERQRYRDLFEAAPLPYFVTSPSGVIEEVNEAATELLKSRRELLLGRPLTLFFRLDVRLDIERLMQGRWTEPWHEVESELTLSPTETVPCSVRLAPIGQGISTGGFRWMFRDLRAEKEAEKARALSSRKDTFLAMVGHELRNPLASIMSGFELLASATADNPAATVAKRVMRRQIQHVVRLVDDLLDASRDMREFVRLELRPITLSSVLEQAMGAVGTQIEQRQQVLDCEVPGDDVVVMCDELRMIQVFVNLLDNASKYTPDGGRLGIDCKVEGGRAIVRVWDEGIGVNADQLGTLSEMFTQGDAAPGRARSGLGIGLGLARQLVEQQRGKLEIHAMTRGTEVIVELPVANDVDGIAFAKPGPGSTVAPSRVLVVDDNADAATLLCEWLRLQGHEAHHAEDGWGALDRVRNIGPDLVLLDIGLPGIDGYEVAKRMRRHLRAGAKIVALSGFSPRSEDEVSVFDDYLLKPIAPERLQALLGAAAN